MERIKNYLKNKDLNPSYQRVKIYEFLRNNKNHPTVDDIHDALYRDLPTLSKTTIYNTLKLFSEKGLVTLLSIDEKEMHCDPNTEEHAHFQCIKCGKIEDRFISLKDILSKIPDISVVHSCHLYIKGVCKECKSDN